MAHSALKEASEEPKIVPLFLFIESRIGFESIINSELNRDTKNQNQIVRFPKISTSMG